MTFPKLGRPRDGAVARFDSWAGRVAPASGWCSSERVMIMADLLAEMEAILNGDSAEFDAFEVAVERVTGRISLPVFRF